MKFTLSNRTRQTLKPVPVTTALGTVSQSRENVGIKPTVYCALGTIVMLMIMLMVTLLGATNAYANGVAGRIDIGFGTIIDDSLSSGFQLQGNGNPVRIESTLEADINNGSENVLHVDSFGALNPPSVDNLDSVTAGYQSQGFKLGRISASWKSKAGKLTIGNDWANFQDILSVNKEFEPVDISGKNHTVSSQIKWLSANGFSISLEDSPRTASYLTDGTVSNNNENTYSPSLILSWQGGPEGAGAYRVTAMGRKLDAYADGQKFDSSKFTGWGLNVEGGWQMDDLFATLSVTFGKGIDSYILQRYGNDLVVTPNYDASGTSLSIRPSLYYSLNKNSNFHVSLGHYTSENSFNNSEIDTLDAINMGYNWSPWPSTKLGIELVGQNAKGRDGVVEGSGKIKFDAQKRF